MGEIAPQPPLQVSDMSPVMSPVQNVMYVPGPYPYPLPPLCFSLNH